MRLPFRSIARLAVAALLSPSLHVHAQMVRVTFEAQAQMSTSSGEISGCGLIFNAAHTDGAATLALGVNGSIHAYMTGTAAIKAGLFDFSFERGNVRRAPSPYRFAWARVDGLDFIAPQKPGHIIPSEDEGYLLFAMPFSEGVDLLLGAATGQRLWLGFKTKEGWERVLSGAIKWDTGAEEQFQECLGQMSEAASRMLPAGEARPPRRSQ